MRGRYYGYASLLYLHACHGTECLRVKHPERRPHLRQDREEVASEEVGVRVRHRQRDALALPQDGLTEVTDERGVLRHGLGHDDLEAPQLVQLLDRGTRVPDEVVALAVLGEQETRRVPVVRVDDQRGR